MSRPSRRPTPLSIATNRVFGGLLAAGIAAAALDAGPAHAIG